jgi:hypothetical protein
LNGGGAEGEVVGMWASRISGSVSIVRRGIVRRSWVRHVIGIAGQREERWREVILLNRLEKSYAMVISRHFE